MRLDAMVAPTTVVGLGLGISAAILLEPQAFAVHGFPLSAGGPPRAATPKRGSRTTHWCHVDSLQLHSFAGVQRRRRGGVLQSRLLAQPSEDDNIIDAVVEEKTAGLALKDEENTLGWSKLYYSDDAIFVNSLMPVSKLAANSADASFAYTLHVLIIP